MLPSGQKWLLSRLRSVLGGLCTGASFTKIDYNFQYGQSDLYYYFLEEINSIPEHDPIFDVIKNYLKERRQAFINAKAELLREIKSVNRINMVDKADFYRRLKSKVDQQLPFPFTGPSHQLSVEKLRGLVDIIDKIILHQASDQIRGALLLPRNQTRDIHQELMYLFNPDLVGKTKRVASYPHVLPTEELSTFFSTLSETLREAKINSKHGLSICFSDQTHMINVRFTDTGWELANINRGNARNFSDEAIGPEIVKSLPHSRQESQLLFSCQFYAPTVHADKVEDCLNAWRQNSVMKSLSKSTYETANFKVINISGKILSWLSIAVAAEDLEKVIELLKHIDNWNDYKHLFPAILHLAIREDKIDFVTELLGKGVPVKCTYDGRNPFHLAAAYGRKDILALLIDNGRGINLKKLINNFDEEGYTPLAIAVEEGNKEIVQQLLDCQKEVLPNLACRNSKTPLNIAVGNKDLAMASTLLESGADPNITFDDRGRTALHLAVILQDIKLVEKLLDYGAIIQSGVCSRGNIVSTLEIANRKGNKAIVALLTSRMAASASIPPPTLGTMNFLTPTFRENNPFKRQPLKKKNQQQKDPQPKDEEQILAVKQSLSEQLEQRRMRLQRDLTHLPQPAQQAKKEVNSEDRQPSSQKKQQRNDSQPQNAEQTFSNRSFDNPLNQRKELQQHGLSSHLPRPALQTKEGFNPKDQLIGIIGKLIDNIRNQKNGRETVRYSDWKTDLLQSISDRLEKETELPQEAKQRYILEIQEVCARRRNFFHFWAEPHSVAEFENLLKEEPTPRSLSFN